MAGACTVQCSLYDLALAVRTLKVIVVHRGVIFQVVVGRTGTSQELEQMLYYVQAEGF